MSRKPNPGRWLDESDLDTRGLRLHADTQSELASARPQIDENMRSSRPGAVLFHGPSGTGKTLAAATLAQAASVRFLRANAGRIVSRYIGETEKNLDAVFAEAGSGGWILFFDEADALFGKRSEVHDSHDRYANQEVSYLLQRVEQHQGLVVLATNSRSNIDPAVLAHFLSIVRFRD